jgi:hypothetical protein
MAPPRNSEAIIAECSAFHPSNDAYIFDEIITESGRHEYKYGERGSEVERYSIQDTLSTGRAVVHLAPPVVSRQSTGSTLELLVARIRWVSMSKSVYPSGFMVGGSRMGDRIKRGEK